MNYLCQFVGGEFNGKTVPLWLVEATFPIIGMSEDCSELRARGCLCKRKELDNRPIIDGYLSPMWNGTKTCTIHGDEEEYGVLRYETQAVYNMLSQ